MHRSIVAAALSLLLLTWPAKAQLFSPAGEPVPPTPAARTLVDLDISLWPGSKDRGHCINLEPGLLEGTVALAPETFHPVTFTI